MGPKEILDETITPDFSGNLHKTHNQREFHLCMTSFMEIKKNISVVKFKAMAYKAVPLKEEKASYTFV